MSAFTDARQAIADALTAADVTCTLDPTGLMPMIFVGLPEKGSPTGNALAGHQCTIPIWIVAPPPSNPDAVDWMLTELPKVLGVMQRATWDVATFTQSLKEFPAYRVDVGVSIENEYC